MSYELKHTTNKKLSNGKFYPLGAALKGDGVNFAIFSGHAHEVYLLLFDSPDSDPTDIIKLEAQIKNIYHVFVHGLKAGQLYGYKIRGPFNPEQGFRFNEHKLLIDPYAKALTGKHVNTDNLLLGYDFDSPVKDLSFDARDNTDIVPKCIVIDDHDFDWQGDTAPDIPLSNLMIYETHLKGFTAHPSSGVKCPGTYLGFMEKIPYLKDLGINAVELLPVHEFYTEDYLIKNGLKDYWGYDTLCYFAPEISYGTRGKPGCQVNEFKSLVRELHKAGIEVILDVVFNHTCEGNELGPTISFRGIDNTAYYYLSGPEKEPCRRYTDYTGCGNSVNASNAPVLRLIMDSLRYWVKVMHVDGFRFDLASALGIEAGKFDKTSSFFDAISQDPVLNRVNLIAEPWDIATYQVGNFPIDWSEWNGKFRDTIRKFGKGDAGQLKELSARLFGSHDIYRRDGRGAYNSVNFVTCHDGFTLYDLVSYNVKHNEANGEENRDGSDDNNSWNCGAEGETENPGINKLREQQIKNFCCYLFASGGIQMMLGGDEFARSQKGNNNAYCQDNRISWFDWGLLEKNKDIHRFFKKVISAVKRYKPSIKNTQIYGVLLPRNIKWYGKDLTPPEWDNAQARTLCYKTDYTFEKKPISLFVIFNADADTQWVKLPPLDGGRRWLRKIDTSLPCPDDCADDDKMIPVNPADYYIANARSTVLLIGI